MEKNAALEKYQALVNKKFENGLSPDEESELARLGEILDKEDEPFYKEAIEKLQALIK